MRSADRALSRRASPEGGFTLLELVVALSLFAIIVINVLADREKSIHIAADARVLQTVRYLAQSKMDEVRHDPDQYGETESGDFSDLDTDWQDFTPYSWELEVKRLVAIGQSGETGDEHLFEDDDQVDPVTNAEGEEIPPVYVRRLTLILRYAPEGEPRPDLSVQIVSFVPDSEEEQNP